MASFPIPPDYSSYCEAMRRATHKWGAKEAFNRLKSLLLDGKLSAYASNRAGKLTRYPPNTWTFYSNDYLLSHPDERYPGMQTLYAATVFLTSELDEVFSVVEQQAEPRTASEPKASANSEQLQRGRPTKSGRSTSFGSRPPDWSTRVSRVALGNTEEFHRSDGKMGLCEYDRRVFQEHH